MKIDGSHSIMLESCSNTKFKKDEWLNVLNNIKMRQQTKYHMNNLKYGLLVICDQNKANISRDKVKKYNVRC